MRKPRNEFFTFLTERSAEIISPDGLRKRLASRKNLRVKLGIDPTTPNLHLGHIVPLRVLGAFQDAGHEAVLIIGDFTGQVGDPSGKASARRQLSPAEAKANERTYRAQVSRVLDMRRVEIRHNSEWYGRMRLADFLNILAHFPLRSAWEREDFQKRLRAGREVRLHEAMYHVLQAYDSVVVRADVEIGSLDQKLNVLAGRELQGKLGQLPQEIVLVPYLMGLGGRQKMSKSLGNTINLRDSAGDMFGKTMSIPNALIVNYAELAAWLSPVEVRTLKRALAVGRNPRDVKLDVAEALVALYYGRARAARVRREFLRTFSVGELPRRTPASAIAPGSYRPLELLARLDPALSRSEARRLLRGRAVEMDGAVVEPGEGSLTVRRGSVIRVGKKKFFRVKS